jgi:hypothetical protein
MHPIWKNISKYFTSNDTVAIVVGSFVSITYIITVLYISRSAVLTDAESYPVIHDNYALYWNKSTSVPYQYLPGEPFIMVPLWRNPLFEENVNQSHLSVKDMLPKGYHYHCDEEKGAKSHIAFRIPSVVKADSGAAVRLAVVSKNVDSKMYIDSHNLIIGSLTFLIFATVVELITMSVFFSGCKGGYGVKAERRIYLFSILIRRAGYSVPFLVLVLNLLGNVDALVVGVMCYFTMFNVLMRMATVVYREYSVSIYGMNHVENDQTSDEKRMQRAKKLAFYGHFLVVVCVIFQIIQCGLLGNIASNFSVKSLPGFDEFFKGHFVLKTASNIGIAALAYFIFILLTDIHLQYVIMKVYQTAWQQMNLFGYVNIGGDKPPTTNEVEAFASRFSKGETNVRIPAVLISTITMVECVLVVTTCLVSDAFIHQRNLSSCS